MIFLTCFRIQLIKGIGVALLECSDSVEAMKVLPCKLFGSLVKIL